MNTFRGQSSLRSWIYSIAINKSKDYLRSWKVRNNNLIDRLKRMAYLTGNSETPEEIIIEKSNSRRLLEKVLMLPLKYREVIILYYFKELSVKEIAAVLSIKETTVRTRMDRGRRKIRDLIQSERGDESWINK